MIYVFSHHELDVAQRELRTYGFAVSMTRRIFDLLLYLIENRDRDVPCDELYAYLRKGSLIRDSALPSFIRLLRQALEDRDRTIIVSLRGYGYRFGVPVTCSSATGKVRSASTSSSVVTLPDSPSPPKPSLMKNDWDEVSLLQKIRLGGLAPLDEAEFCAILVEKYGYTHKRLSIVLGKARNTITELLRLMTLPQEMQDACRVSHISKSVLIEVARLRRLEDRMQFMKLLEMNRLTVREIRSQKKQNIKYDESQRLGKKVFL